MEEEAHLFAEDKKLLNFTKSGSSGRKVCLCCLLQAVLVLLLIVFFSAAVSLGVLYGISTMSSSSNSSSSDVCTTPACVSLAHTINYNLDPSIEPCQDFYNYTCGGWVDKSVIPSGNGLWGVFEELDERNKNQLMKLLEGNEEGEIEAIQRTRRLYQSCMDLDQITKTGAEPLTDVLMSVGGWDLVNLHNGMSSTMVCLVYIVCINRVTIHFLI